MKDVTLLLGDCRESMASLPAGSVHCCVTSPPYFGLRDYGTARWEGGDPSCDHLPPNDAPNGNKRQPTTHAGRHVGDCRKCGARRVDGQLGLEKTPQEFIANMVSVFREVWRVLRNDGTLWLNIGDSYNSNPSWGRGKSTLQGRPQNEIPNNNHSKIKISGLKEKELIGIPWRLAFALQAEGWYLRQDLIWHKPAPMPESVTDRCTKAHEYLFLLTKRARYYYDAEAIKEDAVHAGESRTTTEKSFAGQATGAGVKPTGNARPGSVVFISEMRNRRSVWSISGQGYDGAHFATFPPALVEPCILAGTSAEGCCPTCGAPWVRVTDRKQLKRELPNDYTKRNGDEGTSNSCTNSVAGASVATLGWRQSCKCEPRTAVPCTVLDPFSGSGTTGQVAIENRRRYIGCELNPAYLELSKERIGKAVRRVATPLFDAPGDRQRPLFAENS